MILPIGVEDETVAAKKRWEEYLRHAHLPAAEESIIKEPPVYRYIKPELISPHPDNPQIAELFSTLDPEELAPTPMGRLLLTDRLARMKKASPPGTEVGLRINPLTGKAEAYARGTELCAETFRKKMEAISKFPIHGGLKEAPNAEDYKNPCSHLPPEEQNRLTQAGQEAFRIISHIPSNCNTRKEILSYLRQQPEYACAAFNEQQKAEIGILLNELQSAGLRKASCAKTVTTPALKSITLQTKQKRHP